MSDLHTALQHVALFWSITNAKHLSPDVAELQAVVVKRPIDTLMQVEGLNEMEAMRLLLNLANKGYINYDKSIHTAWITEKGAKFANIQLN